MWLNIVVSGSLIVYYNINLCISWLFKYFEIARISQNQCIDIETIIIMPFEFETDWYSKFILCLSFLFIIFLNSSTKEQLVACDEGRFVPYSVL